MAVDKTFLIKSIQKRESMIVAYCAYTNKPFVVCDPETYNDQVWIFEDEKSLQEFAKPYTEKKILLRGLKYENKDFLKFFSMLFTIGVNELVFVGEGKKDLIALEELIKKPDYSALPVQQQPVQNPELQLTGLYFMQEAKRPVPNEEKQEVLKELEEELAANLVKARYLVPIELLEGSETNEEKLKSNKYRFPILKNVKKEKETGAEQETIVQPIFTDTIEFERFNREKKFTALVLPFKNLNRFLVKDSKGFLLNPAGFQLNMPRELLTGLSKRFGLS